jgi:glutamyl-Q tRNA(Asp) synthetase
MSSRPVFRFAPSPNGHLHLGHALSALVNFEAARAAGGRFLLRMEDIDPLRCRPEYEEAIYEDLAWLGVAWEEPVRRQSEHLPAFETAIARLQELGLVYAAFESRAEIAARVAARERLAPWPRDPDGAPLYPRSQASEPREPASGRPYVLRLDMAASLARTGALAWTETGAGPAQETGLVAAKPQDWGDIVLARKDVPTSYHVSVVVDDALQGVTNVVRGRDLFWSTSVHRVLQSLLGLPAPVYHHHRLIIDGEGRKLAKSTGAVSLRRLRASGASPADIRSMIGL